MSNTSEFETPSDIYEFVSMLNDAEQFGDDDNYFGVFPHLREQYSILDYDIIDSLIDKLEESIIFGNSSIFLDYIKVGVIYGLGFVDQTEYVMISIGQTVVEWKYELDPNPNKYD